MGKIIPKTFSLYFKLLPVELNISLICGLDDSPVETFAVDEEVVHEWFLQSYEESPAYNVHIYKTELHKDFLSHFELHYTGDNLLAMEKKFISQIHNCLQKNQSRYGKVVTKVIIPVTFKIKKNNLVIFLSSLEAFNGYYIFLTIFQGNNMYYLLLFLVLFSDFSL